VGLQVHDREGDVVALGAGGAEPLLLLSCDPGARRAGTDHTGLYHVALLLPEEDAFARAFQRLKVAGVPIKDTADHYVSRSIYFDDPDGNEIEVYVDWPRETWPRGRQPADRYDIGYEHIDLEPLYATVAHDPVQRQAPPGMIVGHLNLVVSDLDAAVEHCTSKLGLEVTCWRSEDATFVSWDGYHSHLALNTWYGKGLPPAPPRTVGMRYFTVVGLPDDVVADPSGNVAHLVQD
jgi:catechol 2,3-dioxygenase